MYVDNADLSVPGLGGGVALSRTWNSIYPSTQLGPTETGIFGLHWRSNYEERVSQGSDSFIKYQRGDGSFWSFGYDTASSAYLTAAPSNDASKLSFNGTNLWTLTFQDGSKRTFDYSSGSLKTIVDRNGVTTTLNYDTNGTRLISVVDQPGRHLYFNYGSTEATYYIVQSVTTDFGISLTYTYDASNRLTQVTKPDGTHITYEYNAQNLITAVKDNQGVVLESHTYDSLGRGLTSARANGVQAVTVTYPQ
ncbi:MAG: RHS repeat protein [Candidatus Koribacter versatilis]|uniref:RHS repeat protein n=1 Tax=Candidatus Korobacter versatilis TaxID=658062 RepID=A0A932EQ72_9BACT|nr:RHS repeat protein [Candidatus Koribacter versatilis]